jgi:hypothetical protein
MTGCGWNDGSRLLKIPACVTKKDGVRQQRQKCILCADESNLPPPAISIGLPLIIDFLIQINVSSGRIV